MVKVVSLGKETPQVLLSNLLNESAQMEHALVLWLDKDQKTLRLSGTAIPKDILSLMAFVLQSFTLKQIEDAMDVHL